MIDLSTARDLLDMGARIGPGPRAEEQLEGAVALHNILERDRVAYLADEVGMGKTYVALGALALFRHFQPRFRVLILAPRENIQQKWMKEMRNFVAHNVRFRDLRVRGVDDRPTRPLVACGNLTEFVRESSLDRERDFFLRLTSFSLPVSGRQSVDGDGARKLRDGLRAHLPWLSDDIFDLRSKQTFKENVAQAINCAIPDFDLVIVDEAHNLKHGFSEHSAARNRVLGLVMGRSSAATAPRLFPHYGHRAKRVLFLSATPIEETYQHLWNQLDIFGLSAGFDELKRPDLPEDRLKACAARFLVRRVTSIRVGDTDLTKNLYRREWRRGGVATFDEPIQVTDDRQRLIVALVQKKVSELLKEDRFKASFQIGMLASFESFLETAKLKRLDDEVGTFDDAEQTDDVLEREGIDVADLNKLARSHREKFGREMPHPKMDALVDSLAQSWRRGEKTLVFVRRVASVIELKRKLDEQYDSWLIGRLRRELPEQSLATLDRLVTRYKQDRLSSIQRAADTAARPSEGSDDTGGNDTFFAWFFRGEGPPGVISGANVQQRFVQRSAVYSTFFEDNYAAEVLGCRPAEVLIRLASALGISEPELRLGIQSRAKAFLTRAKRHARGDRFEAAQAAAIEWLKDTTGPHQSLAGIVWRLRFASVAPRPHATEAPDIADWLTQPTFFTELRARPALRARLWPEPSSEPHVAFRERQLRAHLLASAARLGHAFIDLYVLTIQRLKSLEARTQESADDDADTPSGLDAIGAYLDLLEGQMRVPRSARDWAAFDELAEIADHFELIADANAPGLREAPLVEAKTLTGQLLRQQQPVGGMSGQINQTLVRQFRMPGYPLVLVTTDLLQEGEDLHTFCSAVHHYGISWTPSAMEQRIGRIDRVRSQTDRRLRDLYEKPGGDQMLQVYFPYLEDTVELLQVQRVLERMNVFLRLMHEGIAAPPHEDRKIDTRREFARGRRLPAAITQPLRSSFPVDRSLLVGDRKELANQPEDAVSLLARFQRLRGLSLPTLAVDWEPDTSAGVLMGTLRLAGRIQPFTLLLQSFGERVLVRCISPIGAVQPGVMYDAIRHSAAAQPTRLGVILTEDASTYDLTVEADVLLSSSPLFDAPRIGALLSRVCGEADRLEKIHLPGRDERLQTFRKQMESEAHRAQ
ncbi:MAG TPA: DEAD/DEAH box helicase family protein [Phycisphaerales bacterium]